MLKPEGKRPVRRSIVMEQILGKIWAGCIWLMVR